MSKNNHNTNVNRIKELNSPLAKDSDSSDDNKALYNALIGSSESIQVSARFYNKIVF